MKHKTFAVVVTIVCLVFSQLSLAARFGGGRSRGMQRPQSWSNQTNATNANGYRATNNNTNSANTNQANNQPIQPRSGMGAGTAAVLGAAAGAAGGYMLGKNAANQNNQVSASDPVKAAATTNPSTASTSNNINAAVNKAETHFPWGIISILVLLLVIALAFFKKKSSQPLGDNGRFLNDNPNNSKFDIPDVRSNDNYKSNKVSADFSSLLTRTKEQMTNKANANNEASDMEFMPDGIEKVYFLRQAKGMFLHIQNMNSAEHLAEIAKYMTTELYDEVKDDIANNVEQAKFERLNCQLVEVSVEENKIIAAVRFDGLTAVEGEKQLQSFSEVWNFLKPDITQNKWFVAGIQQAAAAATNA